VHLTSRGLDFATQLNDLLIQEVTRLWGSGADLADLEQLAERAVVAAAATGGPSSSVLAPPYDPPGSTIGSRLAERLTSLRIHRADAHAAAWADAGLTVEQVQALGAGPQRDAIEAETNRRAAGPYQALDPQERDHFLHRLRQLPSAPR